MSFSVVIPARLASTRLPGKLLLDLAGLPVIAHTVKQALKSSANRVVVATDHEDIARAVDAFPCEVVMTSPEHPSGTDRLAEVVSLIDADDDNVLVNVQGDEPLIPPSLIDATAQALLNITAPEVVMATAAKPIEDDAALMDPNTVKVVMNRAGRALYFSRAGIPFARDARVGGAWHHIGIYAYRAHFLKRYATLEPSELEQCEALEQLRVLDHGYAIQVHRFEHDAGFGIDVKADLDRARTLIEQRNRHE